MLIIFKQHTQNNLIFLKVFISLYIYLSNTHREVQEIITDYFQVTKFRNIFNFNFIISYIYIYLVSKYNFLNIMSILYMTQVLREVKAGGGGRKERDVERERKISVPVLKQLTVFEGAGGRTHDSQSVRTCWTRYCPQELPWKFPKGKHHFGMESLQNSKGGEGRFAQGPAAAP